MAFYNDKCMQQEHSKITLFMQLLISWLLDLYAKLKG